MTKEEAKQKVLDTSKEYYKAAKSKGINSDEFLNHTAQITFAAEKFTELYGVEIFSKWLESMQVVVAAVEVDLKEKNAHLN